MITTVFQRICHGIYLLKFSNIPKIGFYHLDLIGVQFFSGMWAIESQNASGLGVIIADGGTPATGAFLAAALLHKRVQFIYGKVLRYAGTG